MGLHRMAGVISTEALSRDPRGDRETRLITWTLCIRALEDCAKRKSGAEQPLQVKRSLYFKSLGYISIWGE